MFQVLGNVQEMLGLLESRLGGRVFALRHHQRIVAFCNGHPKPATRNFSLCVCHRLCGFCARVRCSHEKGRREILTKYAPCSIYVHAILSHKPSIGDFSIPLVAEVLSCRGNCRQHRVSRLNAVFPRAPRVGDSSQKRWIQFSRPLQSVRQSYRYGRRCLPRPRRFQKLNVHFAAGCGRFFLSRC